MKTRFIFFDLGNVLLRFSVEKMGRQGAELIGCEPKEILQMVYGDGMQEKIECGKISDQEFYENFSRRFGKRPNPEQLSSALNDIFFVLEEMQPFVRQVSNKDFPRGILSNVGTSHWNHCISTYPFLLECFPENHVLSYRVGAMKPDHRIYQAAWETARQSLSDIRPEEILFIDDLLSNVNGAKEFGFDAVQFVEPRQLAEEIDRRALGPFS